MESAMTRPNEQHPAFGVTELLEQVLLRTDIVDVFRVKRVCKFWNNCIVSSTALAKKCFLEPIPLEEDDDQMFYDPPAAGPSSKIIQHPGFQKMCEDIGIQTPIFQEFRKALTEKRVDLNGYFAGMVATQLNKNPEDSNEVVAFEALEEMLLNQARIHRQYLHPALQRLTNQGLPLFWTGYGSHVVLVVGDSVNRKSAADYAQTVMKAAKKLIQEIECGLSKASSITQPGCATLTIYQAGCYSTYVAGPRRISIGGNKCGLPLWGLLEALAWTCFKSKAHCVEEVNFLVSQVLMVDAENETLCPNLALRDIQALKNSRIITEDEKNAVKRLESAIQDIGAFEKSYYGCE